MGSLKRQGEYSSKLFSDARTKRVGYDSQATRRTLAKSVTARCPAIKPYDWQIDVAEAVVLGLDTTVIAGTGSGKTLPWAMSDTPGRKPREDLPGDLATERARNRSCTVKAQLLETTDLILGHPR